MQYLNRAKHLVFLPLNTGETIHLTSREASRKLEAFEIDRNARIDRLIQLGIIEAVADSPSRSDKKPPPRSSKSGS